jgi:hypothetical protein
MMMNRENFSLLTADAVLLARLHRSNALDVIAQAQAASNEWALILADEALEHAVQALAGYQEAVEHLPDIAAALDVRCVADSTLLQSGCALKEARQKLI